MAAELTLKTQEQTAFTLRSAAELNYQIRDQLETASNRSDHLSQELQTMRQKIALSDRRREKSASKAEHIRRTNRDDREARREDENAYDLLKDTLAPRSFKYSNVASNATTKP